MEKNFYNMYLYTCMHLNIYIYIYICIHPGKLTWNMKTTPLKGDSSEPNLHDFGFHDIPC